MRFACSLIGSGRRATNNDCTEVIELQRLKNGPNDIPFCPVQRKLQQVEDCVERYLDLGCVGALLGHRRWIESDGRTRKTD